MKYFEEYTIEELKTVPLDRLFPDLEGRGKTKFCRCPWCGIEGKAKGKRAGLMVVDNPTQRRRYIKCLSCNETAGGNTINIMMKVLGKDFRETCEYISNQTGIPLHYKEMQEEKPEQPDDGTQVPAKLDKDSFAARQLAASGLTVEDVTAKVIVYGREVLIPTICKGSLNVRTGSVDYLQDEMLILYYDLEGRRKMYLPPKNRSREIPYTRVRWSNPGLHLSKDGKPIKYQTPSGAESTFYFPQRLRAAYQSGTHIETLFLQEGEKKAEKACKHGIMSVAIQGIGNIGKEGKELDPEIQYLVQKCKVKNIVFLMDSDYNNLHSSLKDQDLIETRPKAFARALIKFKVFLQTLSQCGLFVDLWFAYVKPNEANEKGIDDLLTGSLAGKEDNLKVDIEKAMLRINGKGDFVDVRNISAYSQTKILDLWKLNSAQDFFTEHREQLLSLHEFKFGNVSYKVIDGEFKVDTEYGGNGEFWNTYEDDKGRTKVEIQINDVLDFLSANGYRSYKGIDGERKPVKIENGVISFVDEADTCKFVIDYVNRSTKDKLIRDAFMEYAISRINPKSLMMLTDLKTTAGIPSQTGQTIYYNDAQIYISVRGIEVSPLIGPVWRRNLIDRPFVRERIFGDIRKNTDGSFSFALTEAGKECEFLSYILNTCKNPDEQEIKDYKSYCQHVLNKITCIGYLLRDYKMLSSAKAVIAMDADSGQGNKAEGRTGKSLIGVAISKMIDQVTIDGRSMSNDDDFLYSSVTNTTKNIFIDDVNDNFRFKNFYQAITGNLNVNVKRGGRYTIDFEQAPKFYITSNHAISDIDDSALARICFMQFSHWYSYSFTPPMEFGHEFWTQWDERQWQLFDNLMIECIHIYTLSEMQSWGNAGNGLIDPPMNEIELRTLWQEMGDIFFQWAEIYFSKDSEHINCRMKRKEVFEAYLEEYGLKSTQFTAKSFGAKLEAYCKYTGMHFNAHKKSRRHGDFASWIINPKGRCFIGERDVSNSIEYITISTTDFLVRTQINQ